MRAPFLGDKKSNESRCVFFDAATPDDEDPPAHSLQAVLIGLVSLDIPIKLLVPKFDIRRGPSAARAVVAVPKTSMDERHDSIFRQNDIRLPWQIFLMERITKPCTMKFAANTLFRLGIPCAHRAHDPATVDSGERIHQPSQQTSVAKYSNNTDFTSIPPKCSTEYRYTAS